MENTTENTQVAAYQQTEDSLLKDFKSATYVLSLVINLTVFIFWVTIQVSGF